VPVTRPPIESLKYRKFSSSGEAPIAAFSINGAISAHDFSIEQPPPPVGTCFAKGAGVTGGIVWATAAPLDTPKHTHIPKAIAQLPTTFNATFRIVVARVYPEIAKS
jgi:hypothetical protein